MKVLIYGINYSPELTGIGKYSGEMGMWYSDYGHQVRVITTPPYYPEWQVKNGYSAWRYKKELIQGVEIFRVPLFVPKSPTTITRLLHLLSYSISSFPVVITQIFWKPDIILFIQPTLFASINAWFLAKLSGAKSVMHIQDYEIDAMFGLGIMKQEMFAKTARICESWLMKRFDFVSTISFSMMEKAKKKGVPDSRLCFFPNWVDTEFINHKVSGKYYRDKWGFSEIDKVILYSGNIGKKQGLEIVLDAAVQYQDRPDVHFVFVGQGAHREELEKMADERSLSNVIFHELQPFERLPELLAMADVHLVVQKKGAADLVLPSKLTGILSAGGHTLITAESETELGILCEKNLGIAQCVEPEDPSAFIAGLEFLLEQDTSKPNMIARKYAEEYLDKKKILPKFMYDLEHLVVDRK